MSIFFKNIGGIISTFCIILFSVMLTNIKQIILFLPTYICDSSRLVEINSMKEVVADGIKEISVLLCYICIFLLLGLLTFKKIDLK